MGPKSALCLPLLGLAACSSTGRMEQELSRLRQDMRALRAQLAEESKARESLESKVTLLTADRRRGGEGLAAGEPEPQRVHRPAARGEPTLPDLPVVKLPADLRGEPGLGALDDGGAPVMIRMGPGDAEGRLSVDHAVLSKPDPVLGVKARADSGEPTRSPPQSMNEHYARALSMLRQENDPRAARALLADFLVKYPNSHLRPNAAYWLGECSYLEKDYERAVREFEGVLDAHPDSAKVPDAMLRLALSWKRLGKSERAGQIARRLVAEHPESDAAKQVPNQIGSLRG